MSVFLLATQTAVAYSASIAAVTAACLAHFSLASKNASCQCLAWMGDSCLKSSVIFSRFQSKIQS